MRTLRSGTLYIVLALAGVGVTVAATYATSRLSDQAVGRPSAPPLAGAELVPAAPAPATAPAAAPAAARPTKPPAGSTPSRPATTASTVPVAPTVTDDHGGGQDDSSGSGRGRGRGRGRGSDD